MIKIRHDLYRFKRKMIRGTNSLYSWRDKLPYYLGFKKVTRKDMPDFIIAGLPKCATVWMVRVLRSDNQFQYFENPFFKNKGEIRFFSRNFNQPISEYFRAFNTKERDLAKLAYEKSPDYSTMSRTRIRLIKKLNPDIKIILVFRQPAERAFSNAKMDLVRNKGIELKSENEHYFINHYKSQGRKYDYKKIINNWISVFDESQILVLSLEDIGEKPGKVIEKVYDFLGRKVNINHDLYENPNATISKPMPTSHLKFLNGYIGDIIDYWDNNQSLFRIN